MLVACAPANGSFFTREATHVLYIWRRHLPVIPKFRVLGFYIQQAPRCVMAACALVHQVMTCQANTVAAAGPQPLLHSRTQTLACMQVHVKEEPSDVPHGDRTGGMAAAGTPHAAMPVQVKPELLR